MNIISSIPALDAIRDAKDDLELAVKPYALQIGKPVDAIDYEHLQKALSTLRLLIRAQEAA